MNNITRYALFAFASPVWRRRHRGGVIGRRAGALVLVVSACILAAGCAPAYDWREIVPEDAHYRAMLPAKPASMTREINLDGMAVSMTMRGARIGEVSFTVAEAPLPADDTQTRTHAVDAMRTAMLRNVKGKLRSSRAVALPVGGASLATPAAGAPAPAGDSITATAHGWQIVADGHAGANPVELHALFVARGAFAFQAVVLGPAPPAEAVRTFFDGFRIQP